MPYKRRMPMRRRRAPRRFKRRRAYRRIPRLRNIANVVQSYFGSSITLNANSTTAFSVGISVQNIQDFATFAAVYDQFRLCAVKVTLTPQFINFFSGTTPLGVPTIYTALDFDDTANVTANEIVAYRTCRRRLFNRPVSRYFKPRALMGVFTSGSTTVVGAGVSPRNTWYPTTEGDIIFLGMKGVVEGSQAPAQTVRVQIKCYMQFRYNK